MVTEREPIRFCAAHEEEMVDPGERTCLGAELGTPCEGEEFEYVPADQFAEVVKALDEIYIYASGASGVTGDDSGHLTAVGMMAREALTVHGGQ